MTTFITGTAKMVNCPVSETYTRYIISDGYLRFKAPKNLVKINDSTVQFTSDPVQCMVYGNDQIWGLFKAMQKHGFEIESFSIGYLGDATSPESILQILVPFLGVAVCLLDRHPQTIAKLKERPLFTDKPVTEHRDHSPATYNPFPDYYEYTDSPFGHGEYATGIVTIYPELPITFLWHPALTWFVRAALRGCYHLNWTHHSLRPTKVVAYDDVLSAINRNHLPELLEIWDKLFTLGGAYGVYDVYSGKINKINTLIQRGGWTAMGDSFTNNWFIRDAQILTHGKTLVPWETYLNYRIDEITINNQLTAELIEENVQRNIEEKKIEYGIREAATKA